MARAGHAGARLDPRRPGRVRQHARSAVLSQLPCLHARPGRRLAAAAAARAGQPPRVGTGRGLRDRAQHRRSGALEALPWRHRRAPLDRRQRGRPVPPHERAARQPDEPDVARRAHLSRVGCRRHRQPVFVLAGRQRPAPPYPPRPLLRPPRADRRPAHRLPVRRAGLAVHARRRGGRTQHTDRDSHARAPHPGGAQIRRRRRPPRQRPRPPARPQRGDRGARQTVHDGAVGRRGASA